MKNRLILIVVAVAVVVAGAVATLMLSGGGPKILLPPPATPGLSMAAHLTPVATAPRAFIQVEAAGHALTAFAQSPFAAAVRDNKRLRAFVTAEITHSDALTDLVLQPPAAGTRLLGALTGSLAAASFDGSTPGAIAVLEAGRFARLGTFQEALGRFDDKASVSALDLNGVPALRVEAPGGRQLHVTLVGGFVIVANTQELLSAAIDRSQNRQSKGLADVEDLMRFLGPTPNAAVVWLRSGALGKAIKVPAIVLRQPQKEPGTWHLEAANTGAVPPAPAAAKCLAAVPKDAALVIYASGAGTLWERHIGSWRGTSVAQILATAAGDTSSAQIRDLTGPGMTAAVLGPGLGPEPWSLPMTGLLLESPDSTALQRVLTRAYEAVRYDRYVPATALPQDLPPQAQFAAYAAPGASLQPSFLDTSGCVALTWTAYQGAQFAKTAAGQTAAVTDHKEFAASPGAHLRIFLDGDRAAKVLDSYIGKVSPRLAPGVGRVLKQDLLPLFTALTAGQKAALALTYTDKMMSGSARVFH